MKTYRVIRMRQSGKSADPEFVDVPAISQEHAISVAMAECCWTNSEIKFADEHYPDWAGKLWYVLDADHNLVEKEDGSLAEFALEDEARKYISGLPGEGYEILKEFVSRIQTRQWPRKRISV